MAEFQGEPRLPWIFVRGPLHIELGGMYHRVWRWWVPDGLHVWWGDRGVHFYWRPTKWDRRLVVFDRMDESDPLVTKQQTQTKED